MSLLQRARSLLTDPQPFIHLLAFNQLFSALTSPLSPPDRYIKSRGLFHTKKCECGMRAKQNSQSSLHFSAILLFPFLPSICYVQSGCLSYPSRQQEREHHTSFLPTTRSDFTGVCLSRHKNQGGRTYAKPAPRTLSLANSPAECFPSVCQECQIINYYSTFCVGKQSSKRCLESPASPA